MRGLLVGLLSITACYSPTIVSGVACAPNGRCPEGQECVGGFCRLPGAPADATSPSDRDGDTVLDASDNCPDVANLDQADEDGDQTGDRCDLCPQLAASTGDGDGDAIGDACDPNLGARDTTWLFEAFRGPPGWPGTNGWQTTTGAIRVTAPGEPAPDSEYLVLPLTHEGRTTYDNYSATIAITVEQIAGGTDKGLGIEFFDEMHDIGLSCELGELDGARVLWLSDDVSLNEHPDYAWTSSGVYLLRLVRHGTSYSCDVSGPAGTRTASGMSPVVPQNGADTNIWAYGVTARFSSVGVIGPVP